MPLSTIFRIYSNGSVAIIGIVLALFHAKQAFGYAGIGTRLFSCRLCQSAPQGRDACFN